MKKAIGGYFELELNRGKEYHGGAVCLNTGRNSLEYILRAKKYKKIYLPFYICDAVLEPIHKIKINYEFYAVDKNLNPVFKKCLVQNEVFLYINYFGIKQDTVTLLSRRFENLIIDNSQAFFDKPIKGVDTFYSARKFFGVPDGAYLFIDRRLDCNIEQDVSWERMGHLIIRIDKNAEDGYRAFVQNDNALMNQPIKTMSKLTQSLLHNIDYKKAEAKRNDNFIFLHNNFYEQNELKIDTLVMNSPMVYPYLCANGNKLKKKLIENKIFIATYWENVIKTVDADSFEAYLTNNLLPLPIDQRYAIKEMNQIRLLIRRVQS